MNIKGLATGIGSLPYTDAGTAIAKVLRHADKIPFWPQLPKRSPREGMIVQYIEGLPCLKFENGALVFDARRREEELESFYGRLLEDDLGYFKITPDYALGLHAFHKKLQDSGPGGAEFIKCHTVGPFTFASGINDSKGAMLVNDPVIFQAFSKGLAKKALWQLSLFAEFGRKMIIFLDEPYLGCFGSAYNPLNREDVVSGLNEFCSEIKSENLLIGVHCCGNTDWSMLMEVETVDIINFDAFSFLDRLILYSDGLKKFFERGGILCWGIVPTQEFTGRETAQLLVDMIRHGIDRLAKKGLDPETVSRRLLISPACGLGNLTADNAGKILALLSETSNLAQKIL